MATLRENLTRLAADHPELRRHIVPILRRTATEFPTQDALDKYLKEHPDADRANHKVVEKKDRPAGGKKDEVTPKRDRELSQSLYELSGGGGALNDVARAVEKGEPVSGDKLDSALKSVEQHLGLPDGTSLPGPLGRKVDHKELGKMRDALKRLRGRTAGRVRDLGQDPYRSRSDTPEKAHQRVLQYGKWSREIMRELEARLTEMEKEGAATRIWGNVASAYEVARGLEEVLHFL